MGNYPVTQNECVVGAVETEAEGMYIRIRAQCTPPDRRVYRLVLLCGSQRIDLGVCVPEGNRFVVNTRIQKRMLDESALQFILETNQENEQQFIPVDWDKPFVYLDSLHLASFTIKDEVPGIIIQNCPKKG